MNKKVFVFLAEGFEEVEAITPIDYLRRAGAEVTTVSIGNGKVITGARGIPVIADALLEEINADSADCIVLPGGMPGSTNLAAAAKLDSIIRQFDSKGKLICAICAAPAVVLGSKDILNGRSFTCYPGCEAQVRCGDGCATWMSDPVVVDDHIITSRAAGTSGLFAKKIIEKLIDKQTADKIAQAVLL